VQGCWILYSIFGCVGACQYFAVGEGVGVGAGVQQFGGERWIPKALSVSQFKALPTQLL